MPSTDQGKPDSPDEDYSYPDQSTRASAIWVSPGFCQPEPEFLIECIMRKLLADPFTSLDARDNTSLMIIFEAYRLLQDHNARLSGKLQSEVDRRYAAVLETENTAKQWQQERDDFRSEVKRLELLIAKGKRGMVEVMRARQDSVLKRARNKEDARGGHDDHKETIFEFLERTRAEDEDAKRSQRGLYFCIAVDIWLTSFSLPASSCSVSIAENGSTFPLPLHN